MKKIWKSILLFLLSMTMILPMCTSCKKEQSQSVESKGGYNNAFFEIPVKDGFETKLETVLFDDGAFSIVTLYTSLDRENKTPEQYTDIYRVDEKGKLLSTLEITGAQVPSAIIGNTFAFIGYKLDDSGATGGVANHSSRQQAIVFLDKNSGDFVRDIPLDYQADRIASISDGFIVVGGGKLNRYTTDGTLLNTVEISFSCCLDGVPVFEENGKYFVVEETADLEYNYYEVDFSTGSVRKVISGNDAGLNNARTISGNRYFTSNGEYRVDCTNRQVLRLADWNKVDIRPEKRMLYMQPVYYAIDDDHFARRYMYGDGPIELLLVTYDPERKIYAREKIVLGGFGIYDDLPLGWAIYEFNTNNKKYKIDIDDYTGRFMNDSGMDVRQELLRLMKYFQEGHTPDIFYGNSFDYEYWGRNGMVLDLIPFIEKDSSFSLDILSEAGKRLFLDQDGHCYQVFSSYRLDGYFGLKSVFDTMEDMSFAGLVQYSQDHEMLFNGTDDAIDLVSGVIGRNYIDLFPPVENSTAITLSELATVIRCATTIGSYPYRFEPSMAADVKNRTALLYGTNIGEFETFESMEKTVGERMVYVGIPSVKDSLRVAEAGGIVAVSSSSKNPDICWDFIKYMFSEDVQKTVALNQSIPVRQDVIDTLTEAFLHPEKISDSSVKSLVKGFYRTEKAGGTVSAEQWIVDDYLAAINSPNRLKTYDWGLYSIIRDEVNSYYSQNRSPEQIADTLFSRIKLYVEENYG